MSVGTILPKGTKITLPTLRLFGFILGLAVRIKLILVSKNLAIDYIVSPDFIT